MTHSVQSGRPAAEVGAVSLKLRLQIKTRLRVDVWDAGVTPQWHALQHNESHVNAFLWHNESVQKLEPNNNWVSRRISGAAKKIRDDSWVYAVSGIRSHSRGFCCGMCASHPRQTRVITISCRHCRICAKFWLRIPVRCFQNQKLTAFFLSGLLFN